MKVFVTGVAGFLGSHLADRLLDLGVEVKLEAKKEGKNINRGPKPPKEGVSGDQH